MVKPIGVAAYDKRCENKGRPRKVSLRDERLLIRTVPILRKQTQGCMTLHDIKHAAGMQRVLSDTTLRERRWI